MAVLVTGGAGYIGSHTVRALRERGRDVVVLDTLETGHRPQRPRRRSSSSATSPTPPSSRKVVDEHAVDSVIHFAGYKNPGESMREPGRYFENNVVGTARLLAGDRRAPTCETFVFSGSCSVYGTPGALPVDRGRARSSPRAPTGRAS